MRSQILTILAISLPSVQMQCFRRRNNEILTAPAMHACPETNNTGGVQQCCLDRISGQCGSDQLCRDADLNYYIGGCTDSSFADPACRNECSSFSTTYISWDTTQLRWNCCGDTGASADGVCNGTVAAESFEAGTPGSWKAVSDLVSSATATFIPKATEKQKAKLSRETTIGIGVGAALGGMLLLAALGWWMLWCRRKNNSRRNEGAAKSDMQMASRTEDAGIVDSDGWQGLREETSEVDSNAIHEVCGVEGERVKGGQGQIAEQSLWELQGGEYARELAGDLPMTRT